jgi:hypothetical protein
VTRTTTPVPDGHGEHSQDGGREQDGSDHRIVGVKVLRPPSYGTGPDRRKCPGGSAPD